MSELGQLAQLWEVATANRWVVLAFQIALANVIGIALVVAAVLLHTSLTRELARWICGYLGLGLIVGSPLAAVFLGGWWWLLPALAALVMALYAHVDYRDEAAPTTWIEALGSIKWKRGRHDKLASPVVAAAADSLIRDGPLKPGTDALAEGSFVKAREEFGALAHAGNAAAMNNLGVLHEAGLGVPESKVEALKWYRKAADSGVPLAKHNLAVLIAADHLLGTAERDADKERDFIDAYALLSSAASQGLAVAKRALRDLRRHMTREQIAAAKKAAG